MITIDIHYGKPTVDTALDNLSQQLFLFQRQKQKALCVITGYGSKTGKHKIKTATLVYLEDLKERSQIKDYIKGEDLDIFSPCYQQFKYKDLLDDTIKRNPNPGFVIVIL